MGLTNPGVIRISASDATYSGTVRITGGPNITAGTDASGVSLSGAAQSAQTQGIVNMGVSTGGNTQGNTTVNSGTRMVFVGGNNITLSQDTAANASTISIVGPSPGAAQYSIGVSTGGNTAGATGVTGTRIVFVGSNNISLSQTTDATGATITINQSGGGGLASAGFSTQGNTSGNTSMATSVMQLVGGNNITLSGGTAAGNATITISAPNTTSLRTHTFYDHSPYNAVITGQQGQGTLHMQPVWNLPDMHHDRFVFPVFNTWATNSTCSITMSMWAGLYTKNGSTLSLVNSYSTSNAQTFSGTANSTVHSGPKLFSMGATGTITANDYWLAIISRTTSGGANASISQYLKSQTAIAFSGEYGVASAASKQSVLGLGTYSATTSAMPNSIAFSELTGSGSIVLRAPKFYIMSGTA